MSWFLILFFLKEQNQKALRKTKKTTKQGGILTSPFIGSLLLHFIQFGRLKKPQQPKRSIVCLSVLAI